MRKRFDHISSPEARSFIVSRLTNDALLGRGGYVMRQGPYVLPYPPDQRNEAAELVDAICRDDLPNRGVRAAKIDIYRIVLDFLDQNGLWEPLCEAEASGTPRDELIMTLQDTASARDVIVPAVEDAIAASRCDLALITGIGETYPYVRTHALLGELTTTTPVVLVFPGEYRQEASGAASFDILGIPSGASGGYYRATSVFDL